MFLSDYSFLLCCELEIMPTSKPLKKRKRKFSKRPPKAVVIEEKFTDSNGNKFVLPCGCYFSNGKEQCEMKYIHQNKPEPCIKCSFKAFKYYICNSAHKQFHLVVLCISCYNKAVSKSVDVTKNNTKQAEKDTVTTTTQPGVISEDHHLLHDLPNTTNWYMYNRIMIMIIIIPNQNVLRIDWIPAESPNVRTDIVWLMLHVKLLINFFLLNQNSK